MRQMEGVMVAVEVVCQMSPFRLRSRVVAVEDPGNLR